MNRVSLLSAIVTGNCISRFTCIQDSLEQSGRNLLQAFAHNASNNQCSVHIFCTEHPVVKFKNSLQNSESKNIHFHDCFSDHQLWIKDYNTQNVSNSSASELTITSILENVCDGNGSACVIILESLTPYVLNNGFVKCYHEFSKLLSLGIKEMEVLQIVCLVHEDTLPSPEKYLPQLAHLATSYITVRASTSSNTSAVANIIYKKPGGKIIKQAEEYTVTTENKIASQVVKPNEFLVTQKHHEEAKTIPDDLTTFKLSLDEKEKEARSQLVLPYIRKEQNSKEEVKSGGNVYYHPDAADDWDEEDPDDDLDI